MGKIQETIGRLLDKLENKLLPQLESYMAHRDDEDAQKTAATIRNVCEGIIGTLRRNAGPKQELETLVQLEKAVDDMLAHPDHFMRDVKYVETLKQRLDDLQKQWSMAA